MGLQTVLREQTRMSREIKTQITLPEGHQGLALEPGLGLGLADEHLVAGLCPRVLIDPMEKQVYLTHHPQEEPYRSSILWVGQWTKAGAFVT